MWQTYWDIWVYDVFRGHERAAFAIGVAIIGGLCALPFKMMNNLSERGSTERLRAGRRTAVATRLGPGATPDQVEAEINRDIARERAEALGVPEIEIRHAEMPADQTYYLTVRDFAQAKNARGEALIEFEGFVLGPLALVEKMLGAEGLAHMDTFADTPRFRGWELRQAMERISLPKFGEVLERAVAVQLHRYQLMADMLANGMPEQQVKSHADLPAYTPLDTMLQQEGGLDAFHHAADAYLEGAYPWANTTAN